MKRSPFGIFNNFYMFSLCIQTKFVLILANFRQFRYNIITFCN